MPHPKKKEVTLIQTEDYKAVYIDGELFLEGRDPIGDNWMYIIEELGAEVKIIKDYRIDDIWFDTMIEFPLKLEDVKLRSKT